MELGSLKPVITTVIMPLMFWLSMALMALFIFCIKKEKHQGFQRENTTKNKRGRKYLAAAAMSLVILWLLSCHGTAVLLSRWLLPATTALQPGDIQQLRHNLLAGKPAAIIVLGAGVQSQAAEYDGQPALSPYALERLVYGIHLARQTGLPLGYSGGQGWAQSAPDSPEAKAALRTAQELGVPLRWIDATSRDTRENAVNTAAMLHAENISHVVLVTQAWHMPRAVSAFQKTGLTVTPAPVGFIQPYANFWLEWLPSASGLSTTSTVLREWIGLQAQRFQHPSTATE